MREYVMSLQTIYLISTSLIYNVSIFFLIVTSFKAINLKGVLSEKSFSSSDVTPRAIAAGAAQGAAQGIAEADPPPPDVAAGGVAAAGAAAGAAQGVMTGAAQSQAAAGNALSGDSYSRVTGLVGTTVLVCFIWAVGNVVIYNAFVAPETVANTLSGVGTFILAGSALFAPYAFNQLSRVFGKPAE